MLGINPSYDQKDESQEPSPGLDSELSAWIYHGHPDSRNMQGLFCPLLEL